ncbi:hypothetical protein CEXT_737321 [Caerostris extrusa]|uniref:Uncharacterized protein n=1 Tax=Caerostris extrusa TaxID=172846 RepID=A0AAV4WVB4_CAEEX|nr:hypothetical protein CEXT_737321 [Caerostris extrusa]
MSVLVVCQMSHEWMVNYDDDGIIASVTLMWPPPTFDVNVGSTLHLFNFPQYGYIEPAVACEKRACSRDGCRVKADRGAREMAPSLDLGQGLHLAARRMAALCNRFLLLNTFSLPVINQVRMQMKSQKKHL